MQEPFRSEVQRPASDWENRSSFNDRRFDRRPQPVSDTRDRPSNDSYRSSPRQITFGRDESSAEYSFSMGRRDGGRQQGPDPIADNHANPQQTRLSPFDKLGKSFDRGNDWSRDSLWEQRGRASQPSQELRESSHIHSDQLDQQSGARPQTGFRNLDKDRRSGLFRKVQYRLDEGQTSLNQRFGSPQVDRQVKESPRGHFQSFLPRHSESNNTPQEWRPMERKAAEQESTTREDRKPVNFGEVVIKEQIMQTTNIDDVVKGYFRDRGKRQSRYADEDDAEAQETKKKEVNKRYAQRNRYNDHDDDTYEDRQRKISVRKQSRAQAPTKQQIYLPEFVSVETLAQMTKMRVEEFTRKLVDLGFEEPRNDHILDLETSTLIATELGFEPVVAEAKIEDLTAGPPPEDKYAHPARPPIVTIMGHVDHGKTTILDWLRKSSVVETEHGGITQHIGAFSVTMPDSQRQITFLDTPGHAAFLDMRRRGANVTDIVVLVVAADDSVKPQTREAIKHAKEAGVKIIVAVNKIDKPDADLSRVKQDLAREEVEIEEYGGEIQVMPVSGKTGAGMHELEEAILAEADQLELRAEIDGQVEGWIIEANKTLAGRVATVLVRRGTLRTGDFIVAGTTWGRVRTLHNDAGQPVEEAGPGKPVRVDGWRGDDPMAGLEVLQAVDEDHAKKVLELRVGAAETAKTTVEVAEINKMRAEEAADRARVIEERRIKALEANMAGGKFRRRRAQRENTGWVERTASDGPLKIHFVVKADVAGSVEAVVNAIAAIGNQDVAANVIRSGVGPVSEFDIEQLSATDETGYVISFNQKVDGAMHQLATRHGLTILDHNIIYKVTDDVKEKLTDELPPLITQRVVGEAEIGQIFEIDTRRGKLKIAGSRVTNGVVARDKKIRVLRSGREVYTGSLESLKNVKKDVSEMRKGSECGLGFQDWAEFEIGDQIQAYEETEERRTLYL